MINGKDDILHHIGVSNKATPELPFSNYMRFLGHFWDPLSINEGKVQRQIVEEGVISKTLPK